MAHLYRLIVFLGCLFLLSPAANASFQSTGSFYIIGFGSASATTRTQACVNALGAGAYVTPSGAAWYCYNQYGGGGYGVGTNSESCPANSTLSNGLCTCAATYTENGGTCDPPPLNDCAEHAGGEAGEYSGLGGVGLKTVCVQDSVTTNSGDPAQPGCVLTGQADFAAGTPLHWVAHMTWTGGKCLPGAYEPGGTDPTVPNTPDEPDSTTCAPPKLPGTVNGQTVCVDAGPSDPKQQTSNSSGTETKPDGTTVGTGTTSNTECTPTTCTTTTTTTTTTTLPGGSPTSETTTNTGTCSRSSPGCGEEPGEDEPSSFGGTCGAAFACDGDAIMCAVALEQHNRNCALFVEASAESDLYNAEKGKTGTQYENENVALGTGAFNQSNALGAGAQCIQDRNITVMGNAITLPFSIICSTLQHFGSILIFISFLMAYRIVSRG